MPRLKHAEDRRKAGRAVIGIICLLILLGLIAVGLHGVSILIVVLGLAALGSIAHEIRYQIGGRRH